MNTHIIKKYIKDRIELLVFQANKWGNSFTVEISTVFLPERKRDSNFCSGNFETIENATVWDTNLRYRLKGMYDGWFITPIFTVRKMAR